MLSALPDQKWLALGNKPGYIEGVMLSAVPRLHQTMVYAPARSRLKIPY
jgi:hypothetical protein